MQLLHGLSCHLLQDNSLPLQWILPALLQQVQKLCHKSREWAGTGRLLLGQCCCYGCKLGNGGSCCCHSHFVGGVVDEPGNDRGREGEGSGSEVMYRLDPCQSAITTVSLLSLSLHSLQDQEGELLQVLQVGSVRVNQPIFVRLLLHLLPCLCSSSSHANIDDCKAAQISTEDNVLGCNKRRNGGKKAG